MVKMIKAILFDAYGTLFNEGKEIIPIISEKIANKYNLNKEVFFENWKNEYMKLENNFNNEFMTIIGANIKSLNVVFNKYNLPVNEVMNYIQMIIDCWRNPNLYPDVNSQLKKLKIKFKIGIISNGDESTLNSAINNAKLDIDHLMTSERAKSYKPNKEIFTKSLNELSLINDEVVYIGNSLVDISGAKNAGIRMIHLNRHGIKSNHNGFSADYTIYSLSELEHILKKLNDNLIKAK